MSASRFIALALAVTAVSAGPFFKKAFVNQGTSQTKNTTQSTMFYFSCFQGLLQGYEQGLYNNKSIVVSPQCFGQETINSLTQIE